MTFEVDGKKEICLGAWNYGERSIEAAAVL